MRKVAIMEDRLCIVDIKKVVSLQKYILWICGLDI